MGVVSSDLFPLHNIHIKFNMPADPENDLLLLTGANGKQIGALLRYFLDGNDSVLRFAPILLSQNL